MFCFVPSPRASNRRFSIPKRLKKARSVCSYVDSTVTMPTFASIGLDPDLRKRIVTEAKKCTLGGPSSNDRNREIYCVSTPQALLSRPPGALRLLPVMASTTTHNNDNDNDSHAQQNNSNTGNIACSKPLELRHVRLLRNEVSMALVATSKSAQYRQRVHMYNAKMESAYWYQQQQNHRPPSIPESQPNNTKRRRLTLTHCSIPCTVSAWAMLRYETTRLTCTTSSTRTQQRCIALTNGTDNGSHTGTHTTMGMAQEPCLLAETRARAIPTGCSHLDKLLQFSAFHPETLRVLSDEMNDTLLPSCVAAEGGVPFGYVTQLSGPPASGKTQLALTLACSNRRNTNNHTALSSASAASATHKRLHRTWYICSSKSSCIAHSQRLWELCQPHTSILERTMFCSATNDFEVLRRLAELESELQLQAQEKQYGNENNNDFNDNSSSWAPILLVLDSCSGCLAMSTTGGSKADGALLETVASTIRRLTRQYCLATVLINGTVSNFISSSSPAAAAADGNLSNTTITSSDDHLRYANAIRRPYDKSTASNMLYVPVGTKPALGRRWNNAVADIALWFEPPMVERRGMEIRVVLERHTGKPTEVGAGCSFAIAALGIQDVGHV